MINHVLTVAAADQVKTALLWVLLIIIAIGALGVETTSLAALLATGGMALGMALSGTVQNFAGGVMILLFRPFKVGDYIEVQGFAGVVSEINITSTKLTTMDNRVIVLPVLCRAGRSTTSRRRSSGELISCSAWSMAPMQTR